MSARSVTARLLMGAGAAFLLVAAGLWGQARFAHGQVQSSLAAELASPADRSSLGVLQLPNPEADPDAEPSRDTATSPDAGPVPDTPRPVEGTETPEADQPLAKVQPLDVEPKQGQPIYRLLIPKIKVNNIVVFGSSEEALKMAPGHIEGTPFPWNGGNSAIAAHRDYFFWRLGELELEDEVRVESALGVLVYKVTEVRVVHESNVGVLSSTGLDQITLITCWPLIYLGDTPDRLVITAQRQ